MTRKLLAGSLGAAALAAVVGLPSAPANAMPMPVTTANTVAGRAPITEVGHRGYRHGPYGYRHYRRDRTGAAIAGAALGVIGAIAATAATRSYYDDAYYGYYPAYSYGYYPAYRYGYTYPAYGYAYPAYGYGYANPYWYRRPYGGVPYRSGGWRW
jgi:hypothetical protein